MGKTNKNPNSKRRIVEAKITCFFEYCRKLEEEESKRRNCLYWSELPPDLINSVLERLSFRDLKRGKSVCSAWNSASRHSVPKNQIPWLILFPRDNENRCKLFNPEEKDKMYTSRDLGVGFAESVCLATYGCWLLMKTPLFNFYIVNLLTGERIADLPPVDPQIYRTKLERAVEDMRRTTREILGIEFTREIDSIGLEIKTTRLWIDEETKDYMVMLCFKVFKLQYAMIYKKGDQCWRQIPNCDPCRDMVYKNQKLYVYGKGGVIKISDLSGDQTDLYVEPFYFYDSYRWEKGLEKTNIVVTASGDVLVVTSDRKPWKFRIYKMSSTMNKWQRVSYLDDDVAILLDLGITVPAKDIQGIKRDSIYFSGDDENDIIIFDLCSNKIERPHQSVCSSIHNYTGRWFFPDFTRNS